MQYLLPKIQLNAYVKFIVSICFVIFSHAVSAEWFFRGTPNNWSTTQMDKISSTVYETCQSFGWENNPRFKIDRWGNWSQNYPASDYKVSQNTSYTITFNSTSKSISISVVASCEPQDDVWYFRGTPNNWASTEMDTLDGINFCTEQSFGSNDPRFKVDHFGDWTEAYPGQDYRVDANSDYEICFNSGSKSVSATKIAGEVILSDISVYPSGSNNVDVGDAVQLTVTANYSDGSSSTVTSSASYSSSNSGVATVSNSGYVQAKANGVAEITVTYQGKQVGVGFNVGATASADFREETIYFLMTARFNDGDASNNYYNRDRINEGDPQWRGDFKGLIQKLDYIKDLGFSAIWVTPPVENRSGLDYHGYHAYDWFEVDPRLESNGGTYQDFINAAHSKGLKVIQDVVINHSSQYGIRNKVWIDHLPIKYYRDSACSFIDNGPYQGNLGDYASPFRDDNDNAVAPQWFKNRHNSDPDGEVPLVDPVSGVEVPSCGYNPDRFFGVDAAGLDSNWYHLDGFISGGDWENPTALQRKHMAGDTIDLATGRSNVKNYLNQAIKKYLDMGVDAIRLDTAKHVERNELLTYTQNWQNHKPGLFVFGEVLVKGVGFGSELGNDNASAVIRPWWYTRTGSSPSNPQGNSNLSVLDFPLFSTFRDNVTRGSFSGVGGVLGWDWTYADPTQLVTFFQNHDVGPDNDFKYRFGGQESYAAMAYNLLWTIRGIPSLYYGEEIMFQAGKPQDIAGNNDVIADTGRAYYGGHLSNANVSTTKSHALYKHIKRLNLIRNSVPALQKGNMEKVNEWGSGMQFVRNYNNGSSYAVVGLASGGGQNISVSGVKNGTYRDAVTGNTINVTNGNISFYVKSNSIGVYVLNGSGKLGGNEKYLR